MKKSIFTIGLIVTLALASLATQSATNIQLPVEYNAFDEPSYLCVICPQCCKEKEIEEEDDN